MDKFTWPELDPKKLAFFWPPLNGGEFPRDELWYIDTISFTITEEKSNMIMELFKIITMDPALKHWWIKK